MSYASIAAHNAPPPSEQPHADISLLHTEADVDLEASPIADDTAKVGVVSHEFKEHPATVTSEATPIEQYLTPPPPKTSTTSQETAATAQRLEEKTEATVEKVEAKTEKVATKARKALHVAEDKAEAALHKAEEEGSYIWSLVQEQLLRPGVAGGLLGVVNIGLIGVAGYTFYNEPRLQRDTRAIGTTVAAGATLFALEGWGAAAYRQTPRGQAEERRARKEGVVLYNHAREVILRPGALGGLVGLANIGVLGGVAYAAYDNWNRPWDRRYVSAATVGLIALWGGEGYVAEQVREGKIQPPRA